MQGRVCYSTVLELRLLRRTPELKKSLCIDECCIVGVVHKIADFVCVETDIGNRGFVFRVTCARRHVLSPRARICIVHGWTIARAPCMALTRLDEEKLNGRDQPQCRRGAHQSAAVKMSAGILEPRSIRSVTAPSASS